MTIKERLEANRHVNLNTGCWEWTLSKRRGYGRFNYIINGKVVAKPVHRVSYEVYFGSIPNELKVLHKCDNRCCFNPDHLWLGTTAENNHDMCQKGRQAKGEKLPFSKFTAKDIIAIKTNYNQITNSSYKLARNYHVAPSTIQRIINGKTWKQICLAAGEKGGGG